MARRIVLTSGGSGGHLFPLVAVAKEITEKLLQADAVEFLFLGPDGPMERKIMEGYGIVRKTVVSGKLRRYFSWKNFLDIAKFPVGFFQALWHLFWFMPDVVFSKGGYASVPIVMAAKILFIPVLMHESDSVPGLANRFLGAIADKIAIAFDRARLHLPQSKIIFTGNIINPDAIGGNRQQGLAFLKAKENKPFIFFFGGSQGAQVINKLVLSVLPTLTKKYQIIHQTGMDHYEVTVEKAQRLGFKIGHSEYFPLAFIGKEMKDLYALADVIICRSGANAITEIAANKKPCILVPIKASAGDHQRINAYEVARQSGAIVMEEENLLPGLLTQNIDRLANNGEIRVKMIEGIEKFYQSEAIEKISKEIVAFIKD